MALAVAIHSPRVTAGRIQASMFCGLPRQGRGKRRLIGRRDVVTPGDDDDVVEDDVPDDEGPRKPEGTGDARSRSGLAERGEMPARGRGHHKPIIARAFAEGPRLR